MPLSQQEFESILSDTTKEITENIVWKSYNGSTAKKFRCEVKSDSKHPVFVDAWYSPDSEKLSYAIIYRGVGRIYGLDLGADHRNPDGVYVGEKHKNYWAPGSQDKWAYVPDDITETWDRPLEVWRQFCAEVNLKHSGTISQP